MTRQRLRRDERPAAAGASQQPQFNVPAMQPHPETGSVHTAQFYLRDEPLLDSIADFLGKALAAGDAALAIVREEHKSGIAARLTAWGLDLVAIQQSGRFICGDARQSLSAFIRDGALNPSLFEKHIGGLIESARGNALPGRRNVTVFGEMVAVLVEEGDTATAIELERLWNALGRTQPFALRCAYRLTSFSRAEDHSSFLAICAEHSDVIPSEEYPSFAPEDQRLRNVASLQQRAQALDHETALFESESRFRALVESVRDYAIFMLDPLGNVMSWNLGAERIKGYSAADITGRHFSVFYPPEDIAAGKPERLLRLAAAEGRCEDEGWRMRKNGTRFWASVVIAAMRDAAGNLTGFSKVTRDLTERRQHEEALRKVTAQVLSVQDAERRRLARDLHDSTAQTLTALAINLRLIEQRRVVLGEDGATGEIIKESMKLADQAGREIRNLSHLLHPPDLDDLGLVRAIRWFVQRFAERSGIHVDLDLSGEDNPRLPREAEIALFRIVQEALSNVQRHSGSQTASVRLNFRRREVTMRIQDRGCGIPPGVLESEAAPGVGLAGMRERVRQLQGRFAIDRSGRGTSITVAIPLSERDLPSRSSEPSGRTSTKPSAKLARRMPTPECLVSSRTHEQSKIQ